MRHKHIFVQNIRQSALVEKQFLDATVDRGNDGVLAALYYMHRKYFTEISEVKKSRSSMCQ